MKTKFDPDDFLELYGQDSREYVAAKINSVLEEIKLAWRQELEARGVKVYGKFHVGQWSENEIVGDTHEALLICIKEIKPKECVEHDPITANTTQILSQGPIIDSVLGSRIICRNCKKELRPTWSVCDE